MASQTIQTSITCQQRKNESIFKHSNFIKERREIEILIEDFILGK